MERRTFTLISAGAFVSLFLPSLYCTQGTDYTQIKVPVPPELSLISDMPEIINTGSAYLKIKPDEADREKLSKLLFSDELKRSGHDSIKEDELSRLLIEKVKSDFEKGNIIELNGWILSETEARQCAWISLTQN